MSRNRETWYDGLCTTRTSSRPKVGRRATVETLEGRELLTISLPGFNNFAGLFPRATPVVSNSASNTPMSKFSGPLADLYQAFQTSGGNMTLLAKQFPTLQFSGTSVLMDVKGSGSFVTFQGALVNLGMQVVSTDATTGLVNGYMPISQLTTAAALPQTILGRPTFKPTTDRAGIAPTLNYSNTQATINNQQTPAVPGHNVLHLTPRFRFLSAAWFRRRR